MSFVETGLAFVEGLALIASPCILPVLPLVLSASVDGGKRRPFGIILGFVVAFSLFALASRGLVNALGIDVGIIKTVSLVMLAAFGLVLLSEKLSARFSRLTQGAANLGNRLQSSGGDGFFSGVFIGMLIGLVWTPCAGPVMAAVLVQVIRQTNGIDSLFVIASFALGAGVPMLAIALTGRRLISKFGFFAHHAETVRKAFGVIILLSAAFIAFGADIPSLSSPAKVVTAQNSAAPIKLQKALAQPYPAPDFAGLQGWINSEPLTVPQLKGKVVLVDFWTYSCINCVRTLPYITAWDQKYRDQGLVIVGIHSPEFEFEKNPDNVKKAVIQRGIHYPVALDNNLATWQSFKNLYWPAHYLIDREGRVVYTVFGEGDYDVTENNIRYLLGLKDAAVPQPVAASSISGQTPETYLGYDRMQRFAGGVVTRDKDAVYHYPQFFAPNDWALQGRWIVNGQKITAAESGAGLRLRFKARKAFLVLGTASGQPLSANIKVNNGTNDAGHDVRDGHVAVTTNTLYEIADQKEAMDGVVEIIADQPGLEAYAFTFGQ